MLLGLVTAFIIANVVDIVTAMFILPGETNPIYLLTGSILPLFFMKILVVVLVLVVYFKNNYASDFNYFTFVYLLVIGTFLVSAGSASNIYGIKNPETIEEASELTSKEKLNYYVTFVTVLGIIPYIISLGAFKIYHYTKKKIIIRGKNNGSI